MIAVIAGASGLVGDSLLKKLLTDPEATKVISVGRKHLSNSDPKLIQISVPDFVHLKDHAHELSGEVYFCCLGTTIKKAGSRTAFRKVDFDAIVEFGKIAKANNAKCFLLVSASGANAKSMLFYNQVKGETEDALKDLSLKSLQIFRPGLLVGGHRPEHRMIEKMAESTYGFVSPFFSSRAMKNIATDIHVLAEKMLTTSKQYASPLQIFEASKI